MSTTTLCPKCNTRFRISEQQFDACNGLVRCGRCQAVFDARENMQNDQPDPRLDSPIADTVHEQVEDGAAQIGLHEIPAQFDNVHSSVAAIGNPANAAPFIRTRETAFTRAAGDNTELLPLPEKPAWPLAAANLALLLILLLQGAYLFRVQLAADIPGLKPALVSFCKFYRCTVPLPRRLDLMSIESSDLSADPAQPSVITLDAILRNQALYAQSFPNLELTLTDEQNRPLARRTFSPAEYLGSGNDEQQGLSPNRELNIKLNFDTTDLKPSGYKLFIY